MKFFTKKDIGRYTNGKDKREILSNLLESCQPAKLDKTDTKYYEQLLTELDVMQDEDGFEEIADTIKILNEHTENGLSWSIINDFPQLRII